MFCYSMTKLRFNDSMHDLGSSNAEHLLPTVRKLLFVEETNIIITLNENEIHDTASIQSFH